MSERRTNFQSAHHPDFKKDKDMETGNFPMSIRFETQKQAKIREKEEDLKKFKKIGFKDAVLSSSRELLRLDPSNEEALKTIKGYEESETIKKEQNE